MTSKNQCTRRLGAALMAATVTLGATTVAQAWKPETHVYLAEEARKDALDGSVSIHQADFWGNSLKGLLNDYKVREDILSALKTYPQYYRAGVLGPDAYPDLMFGQQTIHPEKNPRGADAWLDLLWRSKQPGNAAQVAFVTGFLVHAAGDSFAHTLVNDYAGGPFTITPIDNAKTHLIVEGYLGKKVPPLVDYSIDTDLVNGFIYDTLINADRSRSGVGNEIWNLTESTWGMSIPGIYTRLREGLEDRIDYHYRRIAAMRADVIRLASECKGGSASACLKAGGKKILLEGYKVLVSPLLMYMEAWVDDINRGLRAWPRASTEVARKIFVNPSRKGDFEGANTTASRLLASRSVAPGRVR
ncbi:MAG: zinc dependent phospholipase C family protein, partial [Deltaproteobacteria bacterium]|nr:zinc dependent phospholipase C family protein [Deltaproteobacteria bacterium]